jgi:hypothetical protein
MVWHRAYCFFTPLRSVPSPEGQKVAPLGSNMLERSGWCDAASPLNADRFDTAWALE